MISLCSFIYLTVSIYISNNGEYEDEYSTMKGEYRKYEDYIMDGNYFVYRYIEGRDFGWAMYYDPILEKWTRYYTEDDLSKISKIITVDIPTTVTIDCRMIE